MKSNNVQIDMIKEACKRCFPVDIWAQHDFKTMKYAGFLLSTVESEKKPVIRASIVLPSEEALPPSKGDEVRLFFLNAGGIYSFKSPVVDWKKYTDTKDRGVVSVAYPIEIKIAQRRSFFRVPFPLSNRSNIDVTVRFREEQHVVQGTIKDMSGGGIALRCVKSPMNFFDLGTRVELSFHLPRRKEKIYLKAVVCRLEEEDSHYAYGLKFIDHFKTPDSRGYINIILQYIFQYERLMLNI